MRRYPMLFSLLLLVSLLFLSGCEEVLCRFGLCPEEHTRFELGDVVKVANTGDIGLNVRDGPAGEVTKTVPDGWTFRIVSGPRSVALGGKNYDWWEVREEEYEPSPIKGWVAEDFLGVISAAALVPDTPPDYFIAAHEQVEGAISWATSPERKQENWKNLCLGFVAKGFGVTNIGWGCPQAGVNNCPMGGVEKLKKEGRFHPAEDSWNPPRGALIFFSGEGKDSQAGLDYEKCGHIGIYLGNGRVVHAYGVARIDDIAGSEGIERLSYIGSYIGWAYPPPEWFSIINIAGTWSGLLTQEPGAPATRYFYKMILSQQGVTVNGISRIEMVDDLQYYGIMQLKGVVIDNRFNFQELEILEENPPPGVWWCIKKGVLTFTSTPNIDSLSGSWEAPGCLPGEIYLQREG